ncbi:MAG: UDP-glucose 4-epimerase GalE [Candidatus Omnitrophica bacterium]|nr:UDP-glucose 4-epimerase GalE [Candidatus Omnitrophota bacterium]
MACLVTGGAGYIGCHIVQRLVDEGVRTVVLDDLTKGHRELVPRGADFVEGSTADPDGVAETLKRFHVESVIHMAAHCEVGESVRDPEKYFTNNVSHGLTLLEAMVRCGVKEIIFSSTAAVYGEPEEVPIPEHHPLRPTNPYGWSKLVFERALETYRAAGFMRTVALRYFNAAGADPKGRFGEDHEPETHLIPNVLNAVLGKIPRLEIYGTDYATADGTAVRDYIHVSDLAEAHVLAYRALRAGKDSAVYNLGNGKGFSIREIVQATEALLRKKVPFVDRPRRPGDPAVLVASSERIRRELGWRPRYSDLDTLIGSAWKWASKTVSV